MQARESARQCVQVARVRICVIDRDRESGSITMDHLIDYSIPPNLI